MKIKSFGKLADGRSAGLYILRNSSGSEAHVTNYGATLVRLIVPGKDGMMRDVVLGHDEVSEYETGHGSIGATVGRFANRIGGARFAMNGRTYDLTANNGPNALHGGRDFYTKRLWDVKVPFIKIKSSDVASSAGSTESLGDWWRDSVNGGLDSDIASGLISMGGDSVTFCLDSPDGDQGFPGNLHIEVTYTLTEEDELHIDYDASLEGDLSTPLNLTNHSYFNMNGHSSGSAMNQLVRIYAERFTPNDQYSLPIGEIRRVEGTPMDFREAKMVGRDIDAEDEQIRVGAGYDHNFVPEGEDWDLERGQCKYRKVAEMYAEESGILMEVLSDLPGLQLYSANHMNDEPGKGDSVYGPRCAVCFETQFWPDSVNRELSPGGILRAGEEFHSRTTYAFSTK